MDGYKLAMLPRIFYNLVIPNEYLILMLYLCLVLLVVFTLAMSCYARKKVKEEEKLMRRQNEIIAAQRKQCTRVEKRLIRCEPWKGRSPDGE